MAHRVHDLDRPGYWSTWVFVEGSFRRREITAYYEAEGWKRLGGFLFDDLPQGLAALHQPEDEEPDAFFDSVVRILNHSDFLSVSPVPDSVLADHGAGEPYRLPEGAWDELAGLPLWRPMGPPSPDVGRSHLPEHTTPSEVVHDLATWLSKAHQEDNWHTDFHEGGYIQVGLRLKCVRAEVSSGVELGGPALLTPGQLRTLKEIGWRDPAMGQDDWPNYWYEWELLDLDHVDVTAIYSVCMVVEDTLKFVFK